MPSTITIPKTLTIQGKVYQLERLNPDPAVAKWAWRLSYRRRIGKTNETELVIYDVHEDEFSVHCDCPDATYRKKEDTAELCKHQIGLAEAGLI